MGVKSLWELLSPVGRPVLLETVEGKSMAIDSSIWIYQFQATMRDKEGRGLVNAHVLGFLRRICKLLFYGIKPVFVFDGGAPVLKRQTISERKRKKSGAAASHAQVAERLLAAQMRREALDYAQGAKISKGKDKVSARPARVDQNTVYLEDLDGNPPKTPAKPLSHKSSETPGSSAKKVSWKEHDLYRLPEVDFESRISQATTSTAPDPRLATEEELRAFIEDMRPEDIDITSPAFRELPTEVQYEIVGDLRLKSRQTSYKRLQNMLRVSHTPLDFSKEQIKLLSQRNDLTQQLLITTDTIGQAHVSIPIRIASERNKEYVLVKNAGPEGGWVLGLRDEGSQAKPILIDHEESAKHTSAKAKLAAVDIDEDDEDMEEVVISPDQAMNPDLRDFQRNMALAGIGKRQTPSYHKQKSKTSKKKHCARPLFDFSDDELPMSPMLSDADYNDPELAVALQKSLDTSSTDLESISATDALLSDQQLSQPSVDDDLYIPNRLETALAIANAGPVPVHLVTPQKPLSSGEFGQRILLKSFAKDTDEDDDMEEVEVPAAVPVATDLPSDEEDEDMEEVVPIAPAFSQDVHSDDSLYEDVPPISSTQSMQQSFDQLLSPPLAPLSVPSRTPVPQIPALVRHPLPVLASPTLSENFDVFEEWSRSPSPVLDGAPVTSATDLSSKQADDAFDAAKEMDLQAEEGEFAQFIAHVKGKDLATVRREIDEEIRALNQQRKAAMRDSEDITQQMINQIMVMLRLFGIPYITAPMEAEAQCATLVELGLVDGIITDDSDVFLFGGARVYKNMFNQSKTVECFLAADLTRELGLDRDTLIRLAYLLGSDYVEGLAGIGPVAAMELLKEFPGRDGLFKFKTWWQKVQSGRDKPEDSASKFRKRFKKRFKDLYLPDEWPNSAVRDAYYHPTVDDSKEPFKWGIPDLDGLRELFMQELGWSTPKVEELLLPIIQKMNRRNQAQAMNKQGNLSGFFDIGFGEGAAAPRKRQAYQSKRLQNVVDEYREQQKRILSSSSSSKSVTPAPEAFSNEADKAASAKAKKILGKGRVHGRGRGRGRVVGALTSKKRKNLSSSESEYDEQRDGVELSRSARKPNLRPRRMVRKPQESQHAAEGSQAADSTENGI
ncbi:hypothetical protein K488DRAFT_46003 [Vararia minispora EC-137]|uniref:Uncharacterized protein n=1 Tax=Vararia minispora EC-137 TaxID=1314806 RepID=A0ACB8QQT5_9AGAM|nr:hypothetical protein K488DRAFT_46003 [Vararia minispora EC-137]